MPSVSHAKTADATDREVVVSRLLEAPAGVVFETWTSAAHLSNWWGPRGFTTTVKEMDVRPGGIWRFTMHGPDGRDYEGKIVFLEVERPSRLVYRHEPEAGTEQISAEVTVSFDNVGGSQTQLTLRMVFPTGADRDHAIETLCVDEGGRQTLDRLAKHLEEMATRRHLVLKRTFNAPRELVFQAWTDPRHLAQWWGPGGFTNPVCEVDVRPGGKILIVMRGPNGIEFPMEGNFTEVVAPERLAFISRVNQADCSVLFEILNTVTFVDAGQGKTELTLDARVLSATDAARSSLVGMEIGWTQSLERLATLLQSAREQ